MLSACTFWDTLKREGVVTLALKKPEILDELCKGCGRKVLGGNRWKDSSLELRESCISANHAPQQWHCLLLCLLTLSAAAAGGSDQWWFVLVTEAEWQWDQKPPELDETLAVYHQHQPHVRRDEIWLGCWGWRFSKPSIASAGQCQLPEVLLCPREECWCHLMRCQCHFPLCPGLPRGSVSLCVISDSFMLLNEPLIPSSSVKLHGGW